MTTIEKLQRLQSGPTRYELAAILGERRVLIGYCARQSRRTVLEACRKHGAAVTKLLGASEIHFARKVADGATVGAWTIRFTGRTQRDAVSNGELPYVSNEVPTA